MNHLEEKTIQTKIVHKGKFLTLKSDKVLLPNGKTSTREWLQHPGAVCHHRSDDWHRLWSDLPPHHDYHQDALQQEPGPGLWHLPGRDRVRSVCHGSHHQCSPGHIQPCCGPLLLCRHVLSVFAILSSIQISEGSRER